MDFFTLIKVDTDTERLENVNVHGFSSSSEWQSGFPPIREIREFRENFEDFFQSGKSGENRGFSAKIREKNFKSGNFFSKPFLNLLNL